MDSLVNEEKQNLEEREEYSANQRTDMRNFLKEIKDYIITSNPSKSELSKQKVVVCRKLKIKKIPTDIELFLNAEKEDIPFLRQYLQTKPMRTNSGVAVVAVMSLPGKCPHGKCIYCPGGIDSSFGDVPQSYTGNEPATMRGMRNNYDAYLQVMNRLEQYVAIGQSPEKVEMIILGGTFISMSKEYRDSFVRDIYQAMNDFSTEFYDKGVFDIVKFKLFFQLPGNIRNEERTQSIRSKLTQLKEQREVTLSESIHNNEESRIKCVGLTIETKPDCGLLEHGNEMLYYGCTRVELGIQTLNGERLKKINRGHTIEDTRESIRELKDLGFKLNFHMMPGLPGSTKESDIQEFRQLFEDSDFKPDMLKIYPTMVMPGTALYDMYKKGEYAPLDIEDAVEIISEGLRYVPKYCRIMRIQRDIPAKFAEQAIAKNNLRQLVSEEIKRKNFTEVDIKAREVGKESAVLPIDFEIIEYESSGGKEFFISLIDAKSLLLGFVRLRFPSRELRSEITKGTAIVRELHVYGKSLPVNGKNNADAPISSQHKGFGKILMAKAEQIAKINQKNKMVVISGVGVREYYKKLGYLGEGPYMVKNLI